MLVNYSSLAKLTLAKSYLHHIGQMQTFFAVMTQFKMKFWNFGSFLPCLTIVSNFLHRFANINTKKIVYFAKAVSRVSLKSSIFATAKILLI